jgi:acyl-CoA reductase-like NAD-dependent aldehyde dehydrogenase
VNSPLDLQKLTKLQSILSLKKQQLAKILTLETGKPISQALLEIEKCVGHIGTWVGSGDGG